MSSVDAHEHLHNAGALYLCVQVSPRAPKHDIPVTKNVPVVECPRTPDTTWHDEPPPGDRSGISAGAAAYKRHQRLRDESKGTLAARRWGLRRRDVRRWPVCSAGIAVMTILQSWAQGVRCRSSATSAACRAANPKLVVRMPASSCLAAVGR